MKFGSKAHLSLSAILWVLALAACSRVGGPAVLSAFNADAPEKIRISANKSASQPDGAEREIDAAAAALDELLQITVDDAERSITSVALLGSDGSIGILSAANGAAIEMPMPADAFAESSIKGDKGDVLNFLTQLGTDETFAFYQKALLEGGWTQLPGSSVEQASPIRFANESGQLLRLTILGDEIMGIGATMVVLESIQ